MLNNNGPRYKRSSLEKQMNGDIIWCVVILLVLCLIGSIGWKWWLSAYNISIIKNVPFLPNVEDSLVQFLDTFGTFIIILQVSWELPRNISVASAERSGKSQFFFHKLIFFFYFVLVIYVFPAVANSYSNRVYWVTQFGWKSCKALVVKYNEELRMNAKVVCLLYFQIF